MQNSHFIIQEQIQNTPTAFAHKTKPEEGKVRPMHSLPQHTLHGRKTHRYLEYERFFLFSFSRISFFLAWVLAASKLGLSTTCKQECLYMCYFFLPFPSPPCIFNVLSFDSFSSFPFLSLSPWLFLSLSVSLSVCLSVYLFVCLSVSLPLCLPVSAFGSALSLSLFQSRHSVFSSPSPRFPLIFFLPLLTFISFLHSMKNRLILCRSTFSTSACFE